MVCQKFGGRSVYQYYPEKPVDTGHVVKNQTKAYFMKLS